MLPLTLLLILASPPDYRTPPDYRDPPVYAVEAVTVTVDAAGWHAAYKGRTTTFPRATIAADVERMAGEWGRLVDTPVPVFAPAWQPLLRYTGSS
jgi:hypothetical protein